MAQIAALMAAGDVAAGGARGTRPGQHRPARPRRPRSTCRWPSSRPASPTRSCSCSWSPPTASATRSPAPASDNSERFFKAAITGLGEAGGSAGKEVGGAGGTVGGVAGQAEGAVAVPLFVTFLAAIIGAFAAFLVWIELLMRDAAIYVVALFMPLALAASIWPRWSGALRRTGELLVVVIGSKFVIVSIIALAAGLVAENDGRVEHILAAAALMLLACFAPFVLLKLVPFAEGAMGAAYGRRSATGGAMSGGPDRQRRSDRSQHGSVQLGRVGRDPLERERAKRRLPRPRALEPARRRSSERPPAAVLQAVARAQLEAGALAVAAAEPPREERRRAGAGVAAAVPAAAMRGTKAAAQRLEGTGVAQQASGSGGGGAAAPDPKPGSAGQAGGASAQTGGGGEAAGAGPAPTRPRAGRRREPASSHRDRLRSRRRPNLRRARNSERAPLPLRPARAARRGRPARVGQVADRRQRRRLRAGFALCAAQRLRARRRGAGAVLRRRRGLSCRSRGAPRRSGRRSLGRWLHRRKQRRTRLPLDRSRRPARDGARTARSSTKPRFRLSSPDLKLLSVPYGSAEVGVIDDRRGGTYHRGAGGAGRRLRDCATPPSRSAALDAWGAVLASCARDGSPIRRLQWIERTLPGQGDELAAHFQAQRDRAVPLDSDLVRSYIELVETAAPQTTRARGPDRRPDRPAPRRAASCSRLGGGDRGRLRAAAARGREPGRAPDRWPRSPSPACLRPRQYAEADPRRLRSLRAPGPRPRQPRAGRARGRRAGADGAAGRRDELVELPHRLRRSHDLLDRLLAALGRRADVHGAAPDADQRAADGLGDDRAGPLLVGDAPGRGGADRRGRGGDQPQAPGLHDDGANPPPPAGGLPPRGGAGRRPRGAALGRLRRGPPPGPRIWSAPRAKSSTPPSSPGSSLQRLYGEQDGGFTFTLPIARGLR